jgi:hypothetical protein
MSKITDTIILLTKHNSWRRGDETIEMQDPKEIGAAIDDAVNLLRKYAELEKENASLRVERDLLLNGILNAPKNVADAMIASQQSYKP